MSIAKLIAGLALFAGATALAGATAPAVAQEWPTRPVIMVVPYAAGGTTDVIARILGARLSEILGQSVIIENVGGAGGMTGVTRVAKAAPDGYQFVLGNVGTHAQNQTLYKNPSYHAATDFAPVGLLVDQPTVLIARKDLPADTLPRSSLTPRPIRQDAIQFSAGAGSPAHLSCALLNAVGLNTTHVPYRAADPRWDLIAGRIDYVCLNIGARSRRSRPRPSKAIALLTGKRSPILPNIPTAQEQGSRTSPPTTGSILRQGTPAAIVPLNDSAIAI